MKCLVLGVLVVSVYAQSRTSTEGKNHLPAPASTLIYTGPTVTITDTTHPGISPNMIVGDSFTVSISGNRPNSTVSVSENGGAFVQLGLTSPSGNWSISGTQTAPVGAYNEIWEVGTVQIPISFSVSNTPTISVTDTTNPGAGLGFTQGDLVSVVVNGPPNEPVTYLYTFDGGSQSSFTAGYTNTSGTWSTSGEETTVGTYRETWSVGGIQIGGQLQLTVNPAPAPVITGLLLSSGPAQMGVTVNGAGFGATQGTSTVTIHGVPATATKWGESQIIFPVPAAATSGPVVVTVFNQASSNQPTFTVTQPFGCSN